MTEKAIRVPTQDGFANFMANLGLGTDNAFSGSRYYYGPFLTRDRQQLEAMYRNSWVVGAVVDLIAEDMTRAGTTINSEITPQQISKIDRAIERLGIWKALCQTLKWARLFGGGLAVLLIEGQDLATPLRIETIRPGQFKGLLVLDRWLVNPPMGTLVTEFGPDFGKPMYYDVIGDSSGLPNVKVHYSRVLRFDGIELPYYQRYYENTWGESVVERLDDRLLAFDSATLGAAQLIYKAHLRGVGVDGLREALSTGGAQEQAVIKQFEYIRRFQSNEGITILDGKDQFWTHQYAFSGLADMILQFGQQLSGASGIPLVRFFGQSPAGLNSTGESDLRIYYDNVNKTQENQLRPGMGKLYSVIFRSELGINMPEDFGFTFNPLWQMSDKEKADVGKVVSDGVAGLFNAGIYTHRMSLKEIKQSSRSTGIGTNITNEDIARASDDFEPKGELFGGFGGGEDFDKALEGKSIDKKLREAA